MADVEREKLVDKIRKLRAMADGTDNPSEADAFMSRVVRMMEEHAVQEAELAVQLTKVNPTAFRWNMDYACGWQRTMYSAIAGSFGCCFTYVPGTKEIITYGLEEHVRASVECNTDVFRQILRYAKRMFPDDRKAQRRAEAGLGIGVAARIQRIRETSTSEGRSLVLNHEAEARAYKDKLNPGIKKGRKVKLSGTPEFLVGYENSGAIQVHGQVDKDGSS